MAQLTVVYWRDIPAQVIVKQGRQSAKRQLDEYGQKQRGDTKKHDRTWRQKSRAGLAGEEG